MDARKGEEKEAQQKALYQKLVETTEQMVRQSKQVVTALSQHPHPQASRLLEQMQQVLPLVERVIKQTRSRVLEGHKVPSHEKVLSLFEPHTRAIPRHKGGALVEFGRHVVLDEVDGGIVTRYEILEHPRSARPGHSCGETPSAGRMPHPPHLVTGDRGVHSAATESKLIEAGVKQIAIPAMGKVPKERQAVERTRAFRRGYRWRAGIEGRIASGTHATMDGANAHTTGKTGWSGG